ncbi:MAG: hypothetical protein G01um10147_576 [Microgenomates group bacterium Gr01-1014_7]|nr:MAG: hypothetical protein G01um10147_576 [Microgenomates group bacterium Gr01-1014_7]
MKGDPRPIDLSKVLLPYENKWVALSQNQKRVLSAGKTLKEATGKADKIGKKYLLLKVPPFNVSYVPAS